MLHKFCMIIGTYSQKDLSLNLICDFSRTQIMKRNRKLHNTGGVRVFRPQAVEGQPYCEGAFFILTLKHFIYKTDILSLTKKTFKFSPFLYMAMHRPPLPAVKERLIHRSSCPTRFVLVPLLLPIPVTEKYSRTMFQTLTSGAMCPRSVLETCTPLTVWTFRR